jgi:hypothetical protein
VQFPGNQEQPMAFGYRLEGSLREKAHVEVCSKYLQDLHWLGISIASRRSLKDEWI